MNCKIYELVYFPKVLNVSALKVISDMFASLAVAVISVNELA
jgi:hypothetical protein